MSLLDEFMVCVENNIKKECCKGCDGENCNGCSASQRIEKIRQKYENEECLKEDNYKDVEDELDFIDCDLDITPNEESGLDIIKKNNIHKNWKTSEDVIIDCVQYNLTREEQVDALQLFYSDKNPFPLKDRIKESDLKSKYGRTTLHDAVLNEDVNLIKELIDNGSDCKIKDNSGLTPYMLGVLEGKVKAIKILKSLGVNN